MEKLPMCRICLVQNVCMYVVVNKNLHELYEKLTDIPFVTEDKRPIFACFICCAQLKKCYQLLKRCLEAEKRFAQIINGDYAPNPIINQDQLELFHRFVNSPIVSINTVDVGLTDSVVVKEELPAVRERRDDILEPKEEHSSDEDIEAVNLYDDYLDIESDVEDYVPLKKLKIEVEEEPNVSEKKRKAKKTNNPPTVPSSERCEELDLNLKICSGTTELTEINEKNNFTNENPLEKPGPTKSRRRKQSEDSIPAPADQNTNLISDSKMIQKPRKRTSKYKTKIEKPHECDICPRKFRTKGDFITHVRTHTSEKPYKCDVCRSSFSKNSDLIRHVRTHTGGKPYKCDVCQRSFSEKSHLIRHFLTHTGEKPYKCDTCLSSFNQKSSLIKHFLTHTGEKPYKCEVCRSSFSVKSHLTRHFRTLLHMRFCASKGNGTKSQM